MREEIGGTGKTRVVFALGKEEMLLMLGLLKTHNRYMPSGEKWKQEGRRTENMIKILKKGIFLFKETEL